MNTTKETTATLHAPNESHALQQFIPPEVNIRETKDGYVLEADMPGVNKDGLDITLEDTTLTIIGRREKADVDTEAIYRESPTADYRRVFELDPAIDPARIDAKLEHGVLTVLLPKSERAKPRKIAVSE
jgi:HSP20 family protein